MKIINYLVPHYSILSIFLLILPLLDLPQRLALTHLQSVLFLQNGDKSHAGIHITLS
jgi:hypothetical protein